MPKDCLFTQLNLFQGRGKREKFKLESNNKNNGHLSIFSNRQKQYIVSHFNAEYSREQHSTEAEKLYSTVGTKIIFYTFLNLHSIFKWCKAI